MKFINDSKLLLSPKFQENQEINLYQVCTFVYNAGVACKLSEYIANRCCRKHFLSAQILSERNQNYRNVIFQKPFQKKCFSVNNQIHFKKKKIKSTNCCLKIN